MEGQMIRNLFLVFSISAICVMIYALIRVISLNKKIPGGTVGSTWRFLSVLIGFFAAGYLTTPFFPMLSEDYQHLIVGLVFLSGSVFVLVVINLFYRIIKEIGL